VTRLLIPLVPGVLVLAAMTTQTAEGRTKWTLWESYAERFINGDGRVIDFDAKDRTTSEGQSYAMFFALVANDRERFDRLLGWTEHNLTTLGLNRQLPAWLWGQGSDGAWGIQDENSASDSDLWIAYTLIQAGRLWHDSTLGNLGVALAREMAVSEVVAPGGLGSMLLPGRLGFRPEPGLFQLNASYLPVQLLLGISRALPGGPWQHIAETTPRVIHGSSPEGFAMDWIAYREDAGFAIQPVPQQPPAASYDGIRVYLWAGMLPAKTVGRQDILDSLHGMVEQVRRAGVPPAKVGADGTVLDPNGGPGFSAAVIPFLLALDERKLAQKQIQRLESYQNKATGLYGNPPRYYDQNLALFATGWYEKLFSFDEKGDLRVPWRAV
jgi:endoglucanase